MPEDAQTLTTFILFTDIHRSSSLWERFAERFSRVLEKHNEITERAVTSHGGEIMKNLGDGYLALFPSASGIVSAMVDIETQLSTLPLLPDDTRLQLRQVAHGGHLTRLAAGEGYFGHALNRASRILQVCHPGQVLISDIVRANLGSVEGVAISELGLHHLRDLEEPERLFQLDHPSFELHEFPALPTLDYRPNNLVFQSNTFVGREREMRELKELLTAKKQRFVTITAPGGYGKSRLATQLCANLLDCFESGVFEVLLAPVGDAERIVPTVAVALGFQFFGRGEPKQQLLDYLRQKEMLLSFDNFEHLAEGKGLLGDILKSAPKMSILVTSREPLRISGEMVYALGTLPVNKESEEGVATSRSPHQRERDLEVAPPPDIPDSVQLFLDRAMLVKRDFALTPESVAQVEVLCAKLEGVPLAIELAASWADTFTLSELADEFDQQLELTARMDDVPERQRSIRASLDWSYNLLTDAQKKALHASSVFKGGFFFDAGKALLTGGSARQSLSELCDKGWLFAREVLGKTRFTARDAAAQQYALEKLKEAGDYEDAVRAHAKHFARLIEWECAKLEGAEQLNAMSAIAAEMENVYTAADAALRLNEKVSLEAYVKNLARYFDSAILWREGLVFYKKAAEAAQELGGNALKVHALLGYSAFQRRLGGYAEAWDAAAKAKDLVLRMGDQSLLAGVYNCMGAVALSQGRREEALEYYGASLSIRRGLGERAGVSSLLNNIGLALRISGRLGEAEKMHRESLQMDRDGGNIIGTAASLNNLGVLYSIQNRYDEAEKYYSESLELFRKTNDRYGLASALNNLGLIAYSAGRWENAENMFRESLEIKRDIGNRAWIASALINLGALLVQAGKLAEARENLAESFGIIQEVGLPNDAVWGMLVSASLLAKMGVHPSAAKLLAGTETAAKKLSYSFDQGETWMLDEAWALVKAAVSADELAALKAEGEAMTPEELAQFVADELGKSVK